MGDLCKPYIDVYDPTKRQKSGGSASDEALLVLIWDSLDRLHKEIEDLISRMVYNDRPCQQVSSQTEDPRPLILGDVLRAMLGEIERLGCKVNFLNTLVASHLGDVKLARMSDTQVVVPVKSD